MIYFNWCSILLKKNFNGISLPNLLVGIAKYLLVEISVLSCVQKSDPKKCYRKIIKLFTERQILILGRISVIVWKFKDLEKHYNRRIKKWLHTSLCNKITGFEVPIAKYIRHLVASWIRIWFECTQIHNFVIRMFYLRCTDNDITSITMMTREMMRD